MALSVALAVVVGLAAGLALAAQRARRAADTPLSDVPTRDGMTVSQVLRQVVSSAPIGVVVVDRLRDVVVVNQRATELGLVRQGLLDDRVWAAAQRTLVSGHDVDMRLAAPIGVTGRRSGVSVHGHVRLLNAEGDVELEDLVIEGDAVNVKRRAEFETFSITTRDGAVVKARRQLPKRYSEKENEPVVFAPIVRAQLEQLKRGRDGEQPSDFASPKTQTRRDRKTLSREKQSAPSTRTRASDAQSRKMP